MPDASAGPAGSSQRFRWRAVAQGGGIREGTEEAPDRATLLDRLRGAGLVPIEAEPAPDRVPFWQRDLFGGGAVTRIDRPQLAGLASSLAVLLEAGLTLDRSLALAATQPEQARLKPLIDALQSEIRGGASLSAAMDRRGGAFPPVAIALVEAGEASGTLGPSLGRLALMLERAEALSEQIRSALVYPAILVVASVASVLVLLTVVVPQFESFFQDSEAELPAATLLVLGASVFVRDAGPVLAVALLALVLGLGRLARDPKLALRRDAFLLSLPRIGPWLSRVETARFARALGLLVGNGVPLPSALALAARSLGNRVMAAKVAEVGRGLQEGDGLTGPLAAANILPPIAITFLATGEETARLGEMLERLADLLDRGIERDGKRFVAILVPVVTIVVGVLIAGIIGAIFTALLSVNQLAG